MKIMRKLLCVVMVLTVMSANTVIAAATWESELERGAFLEKQNRINEAVLAYVNAEMLSSRPETLRPLIEALHKLGRYDLCQNYATRWSTASPRDVQALQALGVCAQRSGNAAVAFDAFQKAIAIQDNPNSQRWLAHAAYDLGDYFTARIAAIKGLEGIPDSHRAELEDLLGWAELGLGNYDEAKRLLGDKPLLGMTYAPEDGGWRVIQVVQNGPAYHAGIKVNDLVTHFNGQPMALDGQGLAPLVSEQRLGAEVTLAIQRDGQTLTRSVILRIGEPKQKHEWHPQDIAGDNLKAESSLHLHDVRIEPAQVPFGNPFLVIIELTAEATAIDQPAPITIVLSIRQEEKVLTQTEWSTEIPSRQRTQVTKEIPRAAGQPGSYVIDVEVRGITGIAAGQGQFQVISVR